MRRWMVGLALAAVVDCSAASMAAIAAPARTAETERFAQGHPAEIVRHAAGLLKSGRQDEAVFWFYVGQLRYRVFLAARPNEPKSGDPALFSSLMEVIGRPVNEYAFGDISALAVTLNEVLAWDDAHDDRLTPKGRYAAERGRVRAGLADMRDEVLRTADDIRAQRLKNGLRNRS